jgi:hypothetical protein
MIDQWPPKPSVHVIGSTSDLSAHVLKRKETPNRLDRSKCLDRTLFIFGQTSQQVISVHIDPICRSNRGLGPFVVVLTQ